jgi:hypothetical protein
MCSFTTQERFAQLSFHFFLFFLNLLNRDQNPMWSFWTAKTSTIGPTIRINTVSRKPTLPPFFASKPANFHERGIEMLPERWEKVIESSGNKQNEQKKQKNGH